MAGALLANIEGGQTEPKDLHLAEQAIQRFAAQAGGFQAGANQFQITTEILVSAVVQLLLWGQAAAEGLFLRFGGAEGRFPAQFRQLRVALVGELQALQHVAELQPVGLKPVASRQFFVDLRESQPVHLQGLQQCRTHLAPLHGNAQLVTQVAHRAQVALQHQLALVTGGAPGDLRCDRGVAIAVGAHP